MNEVIKTLTERRSIRKFKLELPSRADLEQIIDAGLYAASGMGKQAAIVIAVTNKELRDKISEDNRKILGAPEGFDPFYGAPVILMVLADKSIPTHIYDGSLMLGNLMNAAHSLGLGSIWIHRCREEFEQEDYSRMLADLGIVGDYEGIGHLAVGYVDGDAPAPAPRRDGRVYWCE